VTVKPGMPVSTRNILSFTLEQAGLSYVVENELVKITTTRKAKGRLFTKVFSVADLVTPIPNFALPDYGNFEKMLQANPIRDGRVVMPGLNNGPTPHSPAGGLQNGVQTGSLATTPGIQGGLPFGPGGQLQSEGWQSPGPLGASAPVVGERNSKHEQLIKLLTSMVRPYSWDGMGGPGKVEFFDIGSALVVNQTADVIKEVEDLLEALRRLQDLALAVEIRIVSLSESWYERMGVDFSMNIKTHTTGFEPSLTQIDPNTGLSGVFRPTPFINDINAKGVTVGLTPAGSFTGDLDVPIQPKTFERAIPPFGGYPNTPGNNGGIALGLAFLNDIQVYMFMEAAQGDRRMNVMQAPKLTLFNGQTATLTISDIQFFVANVQVLSVNGQIVFIPNNSPYPAGTNYSIAVQGVVSADRRFVRLNLPITMTAQNSTSVPLFPFTTFVTPVFEGGSQGQPIPFTQFLQQPGFTTITINTTVVCPDGGTVLLGGLKTLSEGRNEFGPPVLSKIPYLNRLFKNVGIGRETKHIMIMVTPRIIINSEEEIFQTEGRPAFGGGQ
jgi:type II secretory pathway component GspD/PulD (secretin)